MADDNKTPVPPPVPPPPPVAPPPPLVAPPVPPPVDREAYVNAAKSEAELMNEPDKRSLIDRGWDALKGSNSHDKKVSRLAESAAYLLVKAGVAGVDANKDGKFTPNEINDALEQLNVPNKKPITERGGRE